MCVHTSVPHSTSCFYPSTVGSRDQTPANSFGYHPFFPLSHSTSPGVVFIYILQKWKLRLGKIKEAHTQSSAWGGQQSPLNDLPTLILWLSGMEPSVPGQASFSLPSLMGPGTCPLLLQARLVQSIAEQHCKAAFFMNNSSSTTGTQLQGFSVERHNVATSLY